MFCVCIRFSFKKQPYSNWNLKKFNVQQIIVIYRVFILHKHPTPFLNLLPGPAGTPSPLRMIILLCDSVYSLIKIPPQRSLLSLYRKLRENRILRTFFYRLHLSFNVGATIFALFPYALWPFALVPFSLSRHLLYTSFSLRPSALHVICSMTKYVICFIKL